MSLYSYNKVQLLGNLGGDPELRMTGSGTAVLSFRVATHEQFLGKDNQKKQRTTWHTVVVWGRQAEALQKLLARGSRVFVEGELTSRQYEAKDGTGKRTLVEVTANKVIVLDDTGHRTANSRRPPKQEQRGEEDGYDDEGAPPVDDDGDPIPF